MTIFEFISVALSLVLGLGLTRLLLGALALFKVRHQVGVPWLSLAWAAGVFIYLIQFWWAIFELRGQISVWTLGHFSTLLGLVLLLFVAAALVVPDEDDVKDGGAAEYFQRDGRWALPVVSAYGVLAVWANWYLWGMPPVGTTGVIVAATVVLPTVAFATTQRGVQVVATALFLAAALWGFVGLAPVAYSD